MAKVIRTGIFAAASFLALSCAAPSRADALVGNDPPAKIGQGEAAAKKSPGSPPDSTRAEQIRLNSPMQYCTGSSYPVASWQQLRDFKLQHSPATQAPGKPAAPATASAMTKPPAIEYPPALKGSDEDGAVVLMVAVSDSGTIVDALAVCSSGQAFTEAALASAKSATFAPATSNGGPVADVAILPIKFHL
jgi:protein TonB